MNERKSRRGLIVWSVISVAVIAAGIIAWGQSTKKTDTPIETDEVTRGPLRETVSATGALQALQTVSVGTQVSGTIDQLYVDFNAKVKRNQLLALIEPSVLDAQLDSARAVLSQATAKHSDAVAALEEGEGLLKKNYISERDLRTLKVNVTTTKGQVDSSTADFQRAKRNRQYAEIRSPIDGVVIERAVDRGQTVAASLQTPTLFTIAEDLNTMQILASVDESQIGSVKVGQNASFSVSAFPGKKLSAVVRQIRLKPTVTQNVVTYSVALDAKNDTGELYPGMTATVDFVLKEFDDTLRVPSAALRIARVPEEMMDEESLKRMKEMRERAAGAAGGEGGPTAEQLQAMRLRMAAGGARPGGQAGGSRSGMGSVWVLNDAGKAHRVAVRVLASDLSATAVEPIRGELKAGEKVITKLPQSAVVQAASGTRSVFGGPTGPPQGGGRPFR